MQKTFDPLYKLDSKGKTRVWFMEQDGDRYRTFDGVDGGTVKSSAWRTAKPTNVGRSNERGGVAQATFEIQAAYSKQLKGAYYEDRTDIDKGCRYVEPMLAEKYEQFAPGEAQPKLDGFRCILKADGGFSREGEELPGTRHIVASLKPIFDRLPTLILDGELYNHDLKDEFGKLSSLIKKGSPSAKELEVIQATVQFHAYDVPSMRGKTRRERRNALKALVLSLRNPLLQLVESHDVETEAEYDALHGGWVEAGFEGSMWRPHDGLYEFKRSKGLRKRKDFDDAEFDIIPGGIEAGEGNWAGAAKRVVCWLPAADRTIDLADPVARLANTFEAGLRGSFEANAKLLAEADQHSVVTIRYFGFTPSEIPKPRFGVATKFHGAARTL
jgi:DNA ligase 1